MMKIYMPEIELKETWKEICRWMAMMVEWMKTRDRLRWKPERLRCKIRLINTEMILMGAKSHLTTL